VQTEEVLKMWIGKTLFFSENLVDSMVLAALLS